MFLFLSSRLSTRDDAASAKRSPNVPIRRQIEQFLRDTKMAPTQFGRLVAKDPRLVLDIRNGREPRRAMADKIRAFIADQANKAGEFSSPAE